ncbi:hypothetical protein [Salinispora arenicola]|uniref:hypothetical protein n=1 Tax=Salinispora arenicola TaxID=168697 RepID=UPI0016A10598|nr:hypothetical protein [Salinispora arenicola]NIL57081.1 hypothetical protein [Salinispora arenicola]NIL62698.1 hypothetical protein [Salinispora arenicola]
MPTWTRVRDTHTGHTFDIDARTLPHRPGVEPVNDPQRWPDVEGPRAQPRPAKPHVDKGAPHDPRGAGRRRPTTSTPAPTPATTSREQ